MWKISWIYHKLHYQLAIAYSAGWPMPCLPSASPISASISSSGPFLVLKCTKQIQLLTFDNQPILTLKSARVFIQLSWTNLAQHRCSSTANSNLIRLSTQITIQLEERRLSIKIQSNSSHIRTEGRQSYVGNGPFSCKISQINQGKLLGGLGHLK